MPDHHQPAYPARIGHYYLTDKLGAGFSGAIFRATNVFNNHVVAVKLQRVDEDCPTNRYEKAFYPKLQGGTGMPQLWGGGQDGIWDYMVIDLLGPSLDSLFRKSGQTVMDLRSVLCIAQQVIKRLEFMHSRGILHRDIQLGNCAIGLGPRAQTIYMLDFGFSKQYIEEGRHIADSKRKRDFIGNYWFSSVRVHCKGTVPSRRDDLEAAALMFIHMLTPNGLHWTRNGVPRTEEAHDRLKTSKAGARPEDLCAHLPSEFEEFLRYCRRLKFLDQPDYERWADEFNQLAIEKGFGESDAFIWPPPPLPEKAQTSRVSRPATDRSHDSMERILNDLANLRIENRVVLGDKVVEHNTQAAAAREELRKPSRETIIISDSSTETDKVLDRPQDPTRLPKAAQLRTIAADVARCADNAQLARATADFVRVLKAANSSRTLTKDGFAVLDALYKQLADPSVFVVHHTPMRTSRKRQPSQNDENGQVLNARQKMNRLVQLKQRVAAAESNRVLAQLVKEFGSLTDRASAKTITKDGFAFLEGVAERMKVVDS